MSMTIYLFNYQKTRYILIDIVVKILNYLLYIGIRVERSGKKILLRLFLTDIAIAI